MSFKFLQTQNKMESELLFSAAETKEMDSEQIISAPIISAPETRIFQCAICWTPPMGCRLCPQCTGIACHHCLETWYFKYMPTTSATAPTCPMCQFPVSFKDFVEAPWIQHLVAQFAGKAITGEMVNMFEQLKRNIISSSQVREAVELLASNMSVCVCPCPLCLFFLSLSFSYPPFLFFRTSTLRYFYK